MLRSLPRLLSRLLPRTPLNAAPFSSAGQPVPVTLIPGDGIGPEMTDAVKTVMHQAGVPVKFNEFHLSEIHESTSALLGTVVDDVKATGVCLRGHIGIPGYSKTGELDSLGMKFRRELDLFANVVRISSHQGIPTRHNNVNMVIVREQIEGEYSALEHESVPGVVECLKIITQDRSRRIAKFAFDYATRHGRKKVTCVHKANIMKLGDGLFMRSCEEIATLYPEIEFETMIVDNCSMQLVSNPHQFDVMVMPNLYGGILTNLAAGLVGGAGVVHGESYSADAVCFEPGTRHDFSTATGKNVANPTALMLGAVQMLHHINLPAHAKMIHESLDKVLRSGKGRTKDLGGHSTTNDFVNRIVDNLR